MTPSARLQAAIDLLDEIIVAARDGGAAADTLIARFFQARRYAGSKDRRAVREHVYNAIRLCGERPESGRAAMLAVAEHQTELSGLFDGSNYGPSAIEPDEKPAPASLLPQWIIPHLASLIDAREYAAFLERAPLDIRVNRLKGSMEDALVALPDAETLEAFPDALRLPEGFPIEQHPAWESGLVEVQDAGSQMISRLCGAAPGQTVIDLCAGAGGKTLALAAYMEACGRLIACDTSRPRLFRLPDRAARAGAENIEICLMGPGREREALAGLEGAADVVLVDAPCSGTGTWRRNPEARWRLTDARLAKLVAEQSRLIDVAADMVKPGGRLVYAVCALTDAEGREQANAFLARRLDFRAVTEQSLPDRSPGRIWGQGRLLSPAVDGTDGFYMVAMERV